MYNFFHDNIPARQHGAGLLLGIGKGAYDYIFEQRVDIASMDFMGLSGVSLSVLLN